MLFNSLINVVNEPTRLNALLDPIVINEDLSFLDAGTFPVPNHIRVIFKNVHIWGKIFSKKLVFAFRLMLRLLRQKCIYELRKSHMKA